MPAVKYSHPSWQRCAPRPHLGPSSLGKRSLRDLSFQGPVFLFVFRSPLQFLHLFEAPHNFVHFLPLPAPWPCATEQSSLCSCPPFPSSSPPFFQPSLFFSLLVIISTVFLIILVGLLLAIEHMYVILGMFLFKMRGVVYLCAVFMFVYPCRYSHSRRQRYRRYHGSLCKWPEKLNVNSSWLWSCPYGVCVVMSTFVVQPKKAATAASAVR